MKWLPWAALVVLGLVVAGQCAVEPRLREQLAANKRSLEVVTFQRDSAREALDQQIPALDSLIDTLWLPAKTHIQNHYFVDTLPVPVYEVRELIHEADTTIRACRATVSACEQVANLERARADTLANRVKLLSHQPALRFSAYGASDLRGHLFAGVQGTARVPLLPLTLYGRAETRLDSLALDLRAGVAIPF